MHGFIEITENCPFLIQYNLSIFRLYCFVLNVNKAGIQRLIFFGKFLSYFVDTSRNYDTIIPPQGASFANKNEEVSIAQISLETAAKRLLKITVPCG